VLKSTSLAGSGRDDELCKASCRDRKPDLDQSKPWPASDQRYSRRCPARG